jgi:hypothetical protein
MKELPNRYQELAERARGGDEQARRQFSREFEPCLAHMLKRASRPGSAPTGVLRQLQSVVRRLNGDAAVRIDEVARDVGQIVAAQLWCGGTQAWARTTA